MRWVVCSKDYSKPSEYIPLLWSLRTKPNEAESPADHVTLVRVNVKADYIVLAFRSITRKLFREALLSPELLTCARAYF